MKDNYQKISLESFVEENPNFINFTLFPEHDKRLSNISFDDSFMLEGVFFALCLKGSADIKVNMKIHHISPDTVLVLQPGQLIHLINKSDDFLIESLYVSVDFLITMPEFKGSSFSLGVHRFPCLNISKEVRQNLLEYHSFIIKRYNRSNHKYNDDILQELLGAMVLEYLSIYNIDVEKEEYKSSKRQEEITDNFFNLLMKYCSTERSVSFYADKLCITPKYLSATVKQTTGRSVLEWIHEVFIINSKMLLRNTNKSISEICDTLNVPNDSFFCRFFKEQTGMSPMQYRNSA